MNIEKKHSARRELLCRTVFFLKMTEQSETTLRNSAVRCLIHARLCPKKIAVFIVFYEVWIITKHLFSVLYPLKYAIKSIKSMNNQLS